MQEVSVIIPNFNGMAYLDGVLARQWMILK